MAELRSLSFTLAVAAVCWVVAITQMRGMDMGTQTTLGSFGFFLGAWAAMMAAMMLPGAAPAVVRQTRVRRTALATPVFLAAYVGVWTLFGLLVYAVYRPHSSFVAGVTMIAAGCYELTPIKRRARQLCRSNVRSGLHFGIYCIGSGIGLMLVLVGAGVMSVALMAAFAALMFVQKVLPPLALIDVPVALAIIGVGIGVTVAS